MSGLITPDAARWNDQESFSSDSRVHRSYPVVQRVFSYQRLTALLYEIENITVNSMI